MNNHVGNVAKLSGNDTARDGEMCVGEGGGGMKGRGVSPMTG
jgi:hypothetical protein